MPTLTTRHEKATLLEFGPHDLGVLARTIRGEADGEGWEGWCAVACVVMNRVRKGGWWSKGPGKDGLGDPVRPGGIAAVCLHPRQFSCWNGEAGERLSRQHIVPEHYAVAELAARGLLRDVTGGATHYYAPDVVKAPDWADVGKLTARIGGHIFFRDVA